MLNSLLQNVSTVYIAYGATDFRKRIPALCETIKSKYSFDPYNSAAYIFCNKSRTSIRILCYDKNGFILAEKMLLNVNKMKFQWPRNGEELKHITKTQLEWLLSGLTIYPKTKFDNVEIDPSRVVM